MVFVEGGDFERYLETLADFKDIYGVKIYAWCLMTNHVHSVADAMVHIDPEDDSTASPVCDLPSRAEVLARLKEYFRDIDAAAHIEQVTLHYFSGRLRIELLLPLAVLATPAMDGGRFGLLPSRGITPSMEGRSAGREAVSEGGFSHRTNAGAVFRPPAAGAELAARFRAGAARDPLIGGLELRFH